MLLSCGLAKSADGGAISGLAASGTLHLGRHCRDPGASRSSIARHAGLGGEPEYPGTFVGLISTRSRPGTVDCPAVC